MGQVFQTSKENRHSHVGFINSQNVGMTSAEQPRKHRHEVILERETDENGMVIITGVILGEAEGHTHQVEEFEIVHKIPEEKNEKVVQDVLRLFSEAKRNESNAWNQAVVAEGFYSGQGQWDTKVKQKLASEDRAALTINEIESKLDILSGFHRRNRTQFKYLPVEGGDQITAEILTIVAKNVTDQNEFEHEENVWFDDIIIAGRGAIDMRVDFDEDVEGKIIMERFPWRHLRLGPHEKQNIQGGDLEYYIKTKMFSKAKVKQLWPDKADQIDAEFDLAESDVVDTSIRTPGRQFDTEPQIDLGADILGADMLDIERKTIRVMELWRKTYRVIHVITAPNDNFVFDEGLSDKDIVRKFRTIPGIKIIERKVALMRVSKAARNVFLDDDMPDLAIQDFQTVIAYAKKRGNDFWGKVRPAIDPQRELNKRVSQTMDILNKMVAYGWFYDNQTFEKGADEKEFKKSAGKPGFMQKVKNTGRLPQRTEGIRFPSEVAQGIVISRDTMREIMAIGPALQGLEATGGPASGVALIEQKKQGIIGNEFIFDNLSMAKRRIGKILAALIQETYTKERIARIVNTQLARDGDEAPMVPQPDGPDGQEQEPKSLAKFSVEEIVELLENKDLTKHDVVVSEMPWTDTMRRATFMEWAQLAAHGVEVPQELLLDLSDLPQKQKEKVLALIQQAQQRAAQIEEAKITSEIRKSEIAAGSRQGGGQAQV